jgi:PPOX class probable F420-dependent enzyme
MSQAHCQQAPGYFGSLCESDYALVTTFRRDGRPVATPVHIVTDGNRAFFRTWDVSGKAKRLSHSSRVELTPCTFRGRATGPALPARALLLSGDPSVHAAHLLAARHPVLHARLIPWWHRLRGWTTQQYELVGPD